MLCLQRSNMCSFIAIGQMHTALGYTGSQESEESNNETMQVLKGHCRRIHHDAVVGMGLSC